MGLEDVLITKLQAMHDHYLDYESIVQMTRAIREQVDWDLVRRETAESPYARVLHFVEALGLVERSTAAVEREHRPHIRVAE